MRTNREFGYCAMWVEYEGRRRPLKKPCSKPRGRDLRRYLLIGIVKKV